ncbi:MAG: ketoacyl-ACP synthase III [Bacteroidales bacterium]|nr:ketoacyl-ACP synthase III [Bacteroidales bacterium]
MAVFSIPDIRMAGIAASVPRQEYNNRDYELISEKEKDTFIKIAGVEKRRVAVPGMTTSDLCFSAAHKLLEGLNWKTEDIELLIFVSQSRDYLIPATAGILQDRLGLPKSCMAFDISLGCSGYVYGLSVMGRMMANGAIKKGLFLVGDVSTQNTSFKDKSTFPLFGDAGSATAIEYVKGAAEMAFNLQTDGAGYKAIIIPDGGIRNFASRESFEYEEISEGITRNKLHIALDGLEVFNFSLREVAPNIRTLLKQVDKNVEDIDYFVMHQANRLMNETIRKQLKINPEKYPYSMGEYGNTSSASIPLTIAAALSEEISGKDLNMLFSGFGVGLSWGSVVLKTDKILCPEIIEL